MGDLHIVDNNGVMVDGGVNVVDGGFGHPGFGGPTIADIGFGGVAMVDGPGFGGVSVVDGPAPDGGAVTVVDGHYGGGGPNARGGSSEPTEESKESEEPEEEVEE